MAEPGADLESAPSSGETAPGSAETAPSSAESAPASESAANEEQQSVESSLISHQTRYYPWRKGVVRGGVVF